MNLNELALRISKIEGKKKEVNIAQIKEVLKCLGEVLAPLDAAELLVVMRKIVKLP